MDNEEKELQISVPFSRIIDENSRKLKYRRRQDEVKLAMHFGQRKLLMTEIEFLTNCGGLSQLIVYAGSAPGIHIPLLAKYFPGNTFELYDPAKFKISNEQLKLCKINIHQELFTDQICEKYKNQNILFISDIRTDHYKFTDEWEEEISENMQMQKKWIEIMKPIRSMVKFRLPYFPGITKYFAGNLYIQPWAGQSSTETRLITDGKEYALYDHTEYEQVMFRHNRITRGQKFDHKYDIPGIDYCYDCFSELQILTRYINLGKIKGTINNNIDTTNKLKEMIGEISETLHINLEKPPHYKYKELPRPERENLLKSFALEYSKKEKEKKQDLNNDIQSETTDDFIIIH